MRIGGRSMPAFCAYAQQSRVIKPAQLGIAPNRFADGIRLRKGSPHPTTSNLLRNHQHRHSGLHKWEARRVRADNSPLYALPTLRSTPAACRVRRKFMCGLNLSSVCAFTLATAFLRGTSWHKHQPDLRISTTRLPTPRDRPAASRMHSPMLLRMCPARRATARPTSSIPQTPRLVRPWARSSGRSATLLNSALYGRRDCVGYWLAVGPNASAALSSGRRRKSDGVVGPVPGNRGRTFVIWRVADRRCLRRLAIVRALQRAPIASYTEQ